MFFSENGLFFSSVGSRFLSDAVVFVCSFNQVAPPFSQSYWADYGMTFSTTEVNELRLDNLH